MAFTPLSILKHQTDEAERLVHRRLAGAGLDGDLALPGIPMSGGLCLPACGALAGFLTDLGHEASVLPVATSVSDVTSHRRGFPTSPPANWLPPARRATSSRPPVAAAGS